MRLKYNIRGFSDQSLPEFRFEPFRWSGSQLPVHLFYVLGNYLEILDAADGSVVFAERVVEHDAGPLARGELGLAEEGDLAAFRAADPDLREEEEEQKRLKTSPPPPPLLISSVYACVRRRRRRHQRHLALFWAWPYPSNKSSKFSQSPPPPPPLPLEIFLPAMMSLSLCLLCQKKIEVAFHFMRQRVTSSRLWSRANSSTIKKEFKCLLDEVLIINVPKLQCNGHDMARALRMYVYEPLLHFCMNILK